MTSAICRFQQQFRLCVKYSSLVHNFNNIFSIEHLYQAGQAMNFLPSQIPECWLHHRQRFHCQPGNRLNQQVLISFMKKSLSHLYKLIHQKFLRVKNRSIHFHFFQKSEIALLPGCITTIILTLRRTLQRLVLY